MDHNPGPNIASAALTVPKISQSHLSPGTISNFQISVRAIKVPAMGVHNPAISRIPAPANRTAAIVTPNGGSLDSFKLARTTSAAPTTKRIRSNPAPGQPPANVEYKRRKDAPFEPELESLVSQSGRKPRESQIVTL